MLQWLITYTKAGALVRKEKTIRISVMYTNIGIHQGIVRMSSQTFRSAAKSASQNLDNLLVPEL